MSRESHLQFSAGTKYATGFSVELAFDAAPGITAIVGSSGSGKTTILQMIAGLVTPLRGSILLGSRTLYSQTLGISLPPEDRKIGYVFQDYRLFPHLSVEANLHYGLTRSPNQKLELIQVAEKLQLKQLLKRFPRSLSGGERQRVAVARAVLQSPALLLLDEPWSAVERELRDTMATWIESVVEQLSIPAILVSHDEASVARYAQKIVTLDKQ